MLIATGSLSYCCFVLYAVSQLYNLTIGHLNGDQGKNPILHISIIYMTDPKLIPQKFDLAIWVCFYFTFSTFKIFHNMCNQQLKLILSNINDDYSQDLKNIIKLKRFSSFIFIINLWFCAAGLWIFSFSGYNRLTLLFYEGVLIGFDTLKMILCTNKVYDNINFYVNQNTEEIHDPFFLREILFDSFNHILQLLHFIQLIYNYFYKADNQFIMHLWILYFFKKINFSLKQIFSNFSSYYQYNLIKSNLDMMFPRVDIKEQCESDVCSICHDQLLVARRIETCGHKFHIKCLFKWLKPSQNSRCPICRSDIPNLNFDNISNKPSIFNTALNYITRLLSPVMNFIFEPNNDENENINQNNSNQDESQNQNNNQDNVNNLNQTNLNESNIENININENENKHEEELQFRNETFLNQDNLNQIQQNKIKMFQNNNSDINQHYQNKMGNLRDLLNQNCIKKDKNNLIKINENRNTRLQYNQDEGISNIGKANQIKKNCKMQDIVYNIQNGREQQIIKQNEQIDNQDYQGNHEDFYDNFEYINHDEQYKQQINKLTTDHNFMNSSQQQLLNLKSELLDLQDTILNIDSSQNAEITFQNIQRKLESKQKFLMDFLMQMPYETQSNSINQYEQQIQQKQTQIEQYDQQYNKQLNIQENYQSENQEYKQEEYKILSNQSSQSNSNNDIFMNNYINQESIQYRQYIQKDQNILKNKENTKDQDKQIDLLTDQILEDLIEQEIKEKYKEQIIQKHKIY